MIRSLVILIKETSLPLFLSLSIHISFFLFLPFPLILFLLCHSFCIFLFPSFSFLSLPFYFSLTFLPQGTRGRDAGQVASMRADMRCGPGPGEPRASGAGRDRREDQVPHGPLEAAPGCCSHTPDAPRGCSRGSAGRQLAGSRMRGMLVRWGSRVDWDGRRRKWG